MLVAFISAVISIAIFRATAKKVVGVVLPIAVEIKDNAKNYVDANPGDYDPNIESGSLDTFQIIEKKKEHEVKSRLVFGVLFIIALALIKKYKK